METRKTGPLLMRPSASSGFSASSDDRASLANVPLFQGLPPAKLALLQPALTRKRLASGEALVEADEPGDAAYLIVDGFVRIQITEVDGDETILAILGPGDIVGEMSLVDRLGRSATAIAHEPATLLAIDRHAFTALLQQTPKVAYNLTRILSRRLRLANAHIESLATRDVDGRIVHQLLAYADEFGEPVAGDGIRLPFHLTQSDLAALVGATRVRVNQVLGDYKRRGALSVDEHHRITLHDPATLAHRRDDGE